MQRSITQLGLFQGARAYAGLTIWLPTSATNFCLISPTHTPLLPLKQKLGFPVKSPSAPFLMDKSLVQGRQRLFPMETRSSSGALAHPFLVGRVPLLKIDYRKKLGTLILASLLKDLVEDKELEPWFSPTSFLVPRKDPLQGEPQLSETIRCQDFLRSLRPNRSLLTQKDTGPNIQREGIGRKTRMPAAKKMKGSREPKWKAAWLVSLTKKTTPKNGDPELFQLQNGVWTFYLLVYWVQEQAWVQ